MNNEKDFQKRMQKIEGLTREIEALPDVNARAKAIELMQSVMELHGAGIERMMEIAFDSGPNGGEIVDDFARDKLVESLLLLYGLHPLDFETRVGQALDKVRPYLKSHGGNAEIIGTEDGIVRLEMIGSCNGCPSSSVTLKQAIEKAIMEAAPETVSIEAVSAAAEKPKSNGFVQIKGIGQTAVAV